MKKQTKNSNDDAQPSAFAGGQLMPVPNGPGTSDVPPAHTGGSDPDDISQLREENEQLKATIRNASAHRQITGELERVGARSPELLFDAVKGDLQFSPDGAVANAAAIVERLRRSFPEQFGTDQPPASIDAGAGFAAVPRLSKESLAKMKPAEIAKLDWEDVKRTLAA